jgi:predicted  nucleic acid-binding Zn-ribbon protein
VRSIEAEEAVVRSQFDALSARRDVHISALAPATRQRYERAHGSRGGRAVVPIMKGACGGCFRAQPPQALNEARKRDRLLSCDGCGRILVLPPDSGL